MTERRFAYLDSPFEVEFSGTRLLEAGAGAGKTWMIAALVLRLLLEQRVEIGRILVVTYTRAASSELRGRIRARLVEALTAFAAGHAEDPFLQALIDRCEPREAQARLRLALESFDTAAIFTIHGFCQRVLGETAFTAALPFATELITDQRDLLAAAARDAWRVVMADASAAWAQWLMRNVSGPDGLVARVSAHLGRVDARLAAPEAADRPAAERDFSDAYAAVRGLWPFASAAVCDLLGDARMKQNSYSPRQVQSRVIALDAFLKSPDALLPLPEGAAYFGTEKILAGTKQAAEPPEHAFFFAMDALLRAAQLLQRVFEEETRRLLRDFLLLARRELAVIKHRNGLQSYDDLLVNLDRALGGAAGERLVEYLRNRYRIALVDEFQDTDPAQWRIFKRLFGTAEHPLILVGDPKQAIYGFRGADVFTYLAARAHAAEGYALLDNHRSSPLLVAAVNELFARPRPFLIDGMPFEAARPAVKARAVLTLPDAGAPLTLWTMDPPQGVKGFPKEAARHQAAAAVAADIARLLRLAEDGKAMLDGRPLGGGDLAVLVRKHHEGEAVRAALARRGIASVSGGGGSVWGSDEALDIERLLLALAAPADTGAVRAALATVLLGIDAAQLTAWRDDSDSVGRSGTWSERLDCFSDDQRLMRARGFMAMWRRLLHREAVVARVLARPDGERRLTNYLHIAELLQAAEQGGALDAAGLLRYMVRQRDAAESEESQLRLESDARLVRIVTLHAAKGLQYPVVYCPFLWLGSEEDKHGWPVLAHDPAQDGGAAQLDFGSDQFTALRARAEQEAAAEELRLAYVALTRAEHRCVVVWGKVNQCARAPLAWLLFGPRHETRGDSRAVLADWLAAHDDRAALQSLEDRLAGALRVLPLPTEEEVVQPIRETALRLHPREFAGQVPAPWPVRSFSSLAASLAEEVEMAETADRDAEILPSAVSSAPSFDGIDAFPRGMRAGSCLHSLFERIDFQQADTHGPAVVAVLREYGYAPEWRPVLEQLVRDVLYAPLQAEGLKLADLSCQARLIELEFVFPLRSKAEQTGYMKGFIDLVFQHAERWFIVDWKSNWLETYESASLSAAMQAHRYDLQQRIYAAALYRALAAREPQLDWETSFGGVFYLFLRGIRPDSQNGIHFCRPSLDDIAEFLP